MVLAFELALKQLSVAQLKKLAFLYQKDVSQCETKDDYVGLLIATMTNQQKLAALRSFLLAGRTSMALFQFTDERVNVEPAANFQVATAVPTIVTVGEAGEIVDGLRHIAWAVLDGQNTYLDPYLNLQVEPEAVVIDSFYDPDVRILQVRGGYSAARKISKQWAITAGVEPDSGITSLGLTTLEEVHGFCDQIEGHIVKCHGEKIESEGFHKMTAGVHPNHPDLRGTPDYERFVAETEAVGSDIEFTFEDRTVCVSIGLVTRSIVFRTLSNEPTMQYVYGKLKEFWQL